MHYVWTKSQADVCHWEARLELCYSQYNGVITYTYSPINIHKQHVFRLCVNYAVDTSGLKKLNNTDNYSNKYTAVPWLGRLVVDLSTRRPGFGSRCLHVAIILDSVALELVFLHVLPLSPISIIPSNPHGY